jgi:hypothetical protein
MALIVNGTTITRVAYAGSYMRTVINNGTTLFNLSDWTYIGTSSSFTINLGDYNHDFYNFPSQVPEGVLSSYLTSSFPVQNYGATVVGQVAIYAYINFSYTFIRYEYYRINQTVGAAPPAPTYSWVWVDWDYVPFSADYSLTGGESTNETMAVEIQFYYPANSNQGKYVNYFNGSYYNLFYSTT